MDRRAKVNRKTSEVEVTVDINLDGKGKFDIETGIPFFNHMLSQFAKHGYFDLSLKAWKGAILDKHVNSLSRPHAVFNVQTWHF